MKEKIKNSKVSKTAFLISFLLTCLLPQRAYADVAGAGIAVVGVMMVIIMCAVIVAIGGLSFYVIRLIKKRYDDNNK